MAVRNLNIDWKKHYDEHQVTNEFVAENFFKDHDHWWIGQCSQVPYTLLDYLYQHKEYQNPADTASYDNFRKHRKTERTQCGQRKCRHAE